MTDAPSFNPWAIPIFPQDSSNGWQTMPVGDYQMPVAAPVNPLIAPDGLHFGDRRPDETNEARDARLQPFFQSVPGLMQQFNQKAPDQWTPQELQKFQQTPQFIAAAKSAFPRRK